MVRAVHGPESESVRAKMAERESIMRKMMNGFGMMAKRGTAAAMAAAMALTMAGCGSSGAAESTVAGDASEGSAEAGDASKTADSEAKGDIKVGVIQMIDNGAFADMRDGFSEELTEKYTGGKVDIVYKNAQGDAAALNTICQEMADSGVDLIATIATPATQAMVNLETDIPVFFIAVSNPVGAGVITDMEKPDKNATGTSNAIPVEDIFTLSDKLTPDCKTYGMLYNTSEVNSVSTVENAKKYLDEQGLSYKEAVVTNSSEVQQAAQSLVGEVDAIFVPNDSVIQSAMPMVTEVARNAKIPVYGSSAVMVDSGAFATIAVSDTEIGAQTADMALEYLNGTAIEDIAAVVVPASNMVINQDTADALEITFSDEVQKEATFVKDAE